MKNLKIFLSVIICIPVALYFWNEHKPSPPALSKEERKSFETARCHFEITEYRALKSFGNFPGMHPPKGALYVRIAFTIRNTQGHESTSLNFGNLFLLVDGAGNTHKPIPFFLTGENGGVSLEPKTEKPGAILFEIAEEDVKNRELLLQTDDASLRFPAPRIDEN
jgi:hypothetical protein